MNRQVSFPWKTNRQAPADPAAAVRRPELVAQVPRVALDSREAAAALSVSLTTLESLRRGGSGPPSFVLPGGKRRVYPVRELIEWVSSLAAAGDQDGVEDASGSASPDGDDGEISAESGKSSSLESVSE